MARDSFLIHYSHRRSQRSTGAADGKSAEIGCVTAKPVNAIGRSRKSRAGEFPPVEVVGEAIDGAGVDSQIRRLTIAGDVHAGAGVGVAVDSDSGGVCGRDAGVAGGVDVAVREDDGVPAARDRIAMFTCMVEV